MTTYQSTDASGFRRNQLVQVKGTGEFMRYQGRDNWRIQAAKAPGRNTRCGCGSGAKFKNCFLKEKCVV